STAFLASSPAASITEGLEVLVQLVMAAMTTLPWCSCFFTSTSTGFSAAGASASSTPTAVGLPPSPSQRPMTGSALLAAGAVVLAAAAATALGGLIREGRACWKDSPARERG